MHLTKRDAEILMQLVDEEIKRICAQSVDTAMTDEEYDKAYTLNPAKIIGECKACHHLYDICRNGLCCDACGNTGVSGARWADTQGPVIALDPDAAKEIVWLEKLYALEGYRETDYNQR